MPAHQPAADNGGKVVDVFFHEEGGETDIGAVADAHEKIVDQVVEMDDDLMEVYLEEGEIAPEKLHDAFEEALRDGHLVPVCFVSAATGTGIAELLEVIVKLMHRRARATRLRFVTGDPAAPVALSADPQAHAVATCGQGGYRPLPRSHGLSARTPGNAAARPANLRGRCAQAVED